MAVWVPKNGWLNLGMVGPSTVLGSHFDTPTPAALGRHHLWQGSGELEDIQVSSFGPELGVVKALATLCDGVAIAKTAVSGTPAVTWTADHLAAFTTAVNAFHRPPTDVLITSVNEAILEADSLAYEANELARMVAIRALCGAGCRFWFFDHWAVPIGTYPFQANVFAAVDSIVAADALAFQFDCTDISLRADLIHPDGDGSEDIGTRWVAAMQLAGAL